MSKKPELRQSHQSAGDGVLLGPGMRSRPRPQSAEAAMRITVQQCGQQHGYRLGFHLKVSTCRAQQWQFVAAHTLDDEEQGWLVLWSIVAEAHTIQLILAGVCV